MRSDQPVAIVIDSSLSATISLPDQDAASDGLLHLATVQPVLGKILMLMLIPAWTRREDSAW